MGLIRVPIFKLYMGTKSDKDYNGGLPRFIQNSFAGDGNALHQLLIGLLFTNVMTEAEIVTVLMRSKCTNSVYSFDN